MSTEIETDHKNDVVKVIVFAPRSPDPHRFKWSKRLTVGEAADEAASKFGYAAGKPTLAKAGVTLARDSRLGAAGVKDGDELELVDIGGGV